MKLTGQRAMFRLSFEGRQALGQIAPESGTFESFIVDEDERGVWIELPDQPETELGKPRLVMLLKWEHFATATLSYEKGDRRSVE